MTARALLIHGNASRARAWDDVRTRLAAAHIDVTAEDLPGFGESPQPDGDFDATVDAWLAGTPCVVVGHGAGALRAARVF